MNEYLKALLSVEILGGAGIALILMGTLLASINRLHPKLFSFRYTYSEGLRNASHVERADRLDEETKLIQRRIPIYGYVFLVAGVAAIMIGGFLSE